MENPWRMSKKGASRSGGFSLWVQTFRPPDPEGSRGIPGGDGVKSIVGGVSYVRSRIEG